MHRFALPIVLLLLASCSQPQQPAPTLRVASFNIRFDNPNDGVHAWPERKAQVAGLIRFHAPDLLGLQEALAHQIDTLAASLPAYTWLGVGRSDGERGGEFSPIFYRTDRFALLDHGTFWLSETPEVIASLGWDAAITRLVTWAQLRDERTGAVFLFANTHFDHIGRQARTESARLLRERLPAHAHGHEIVLVGDFNVTDTTAAYTTLTEAGFFRDAYRHTATPPYGPEGTCCGFTVRAERGRRIDYLFVTEGFSILSYATLADQVRAHYPSDHRPVLADLRHR